MIMKTAILSLYVRIAVVLVESSAVSNNNEGLSKGYFSNVK